MELFVATPHGAALSTTKKALAPGQSTI
jgi:hypothetical protein